MCTHTRTRLHLRTHAHTSVHAHTRTHSQDPQRFLEEENIQVPLLFLSFPSAKVGRLVAFRMSASPCRRPMYCCCKYPSGCAHASHTKQWHSNMPLTAYAINQDPSWAKEFPEKSTCELVTVAPWAWFERWADARPLHRGDEYVASLSQKSAVWPCRR